MKQLFIVLLECQISKCDENCLLDVLKKPCEDNWIKILSIERIKLEEILEDES